MDDRKLSTDETNPFTTAIAPPTIEDRRSNPTQPAIDYSFGYENNMFIRSVDLIAKYFFGVVLGCTATGVCAGYLTGLTVPVADSIPFFVIVYGVVGLLTGLTFGLAAIFLRRYFDLSDQENLHHQRRYAIFGVIIGLVYFFCVITFYENFYKAFPGLLVTAGSIVYTMLASKSIADLEDEEIRNRPPTEIKRRVRRIV